VLYKAKLGTNKLKIAYICTTRISCEERNSQCNIWWDKTGGKANHSFHPFEQSKRKEIAMYLYFSKENICYM